jgi:hypothetical protein
MTGTEGQDRLARLENLAEEVLVGIAQLRLSQAKTDDQIRELKNSQAKTDDQIRELKDSQAKTDDQIRELKDSQAKTDDQIRRTDAKLDRIGRQLGELGLVQGEVAEDLFYRNLRGAFRKAKLELKKVMRNLKRKGDLEYDLVAVNGGRVLVVEVKNKLERRMVDRFVGSKLPRFKQLFPEFENYEVVGGMGALVVKDEVGRYAEKAGLYVITQTEEGGATVLNQEGFEPRTFN